MVGSDERPSSYEDVEGPILVDEWWEWSVTEALIMAVCVGIGSVLYGLGATGLGQLYIVLGTILYVLTPSVRGPIA